MAEELTPTKQDKFDESHELLTQSLTPKDDVKDYEIHVCEVQLEKLKQILSDDSSPFRDLQDFMPSTLTFPDQFHEMIAEIEKDGCEIAIKKGLTHEIIGEAIASAEAIKKDRDEGDRIRLNEMMQQKVRQSSSYSRFSFAKLVNSKRADGGSISFPSATALEIKPESQMAKDWDKLAPQILPPDQQRLINHANTRSTIPTKLQIEAASKLVAGYINRDNPRSLAFLRADFGRSVSVGLQSRIEVLGLGSIEGAHANGEISTRGSDGQNPELCGGQAARDTQSSTSRDEGRPQTGNMRATILSDDETAEKKKAAEQVLIHGDLNFGVGSVVNSLGVRCIQMSNETAVIIAERRSFQKLYLAAMIAALEIEKRKDDGLLPDAEIDLLLEIAKGWELKPTNNIELLYDPSPFSVYLSCANDGMNDGTNLEAKIRHCTQDVQQLGFFANLGTFLTECVIRKQDSYANCWVRMLKAQAALAALPPPPGIDLESLGFIIEKDGTPRLFNGKFIIFKFLQEIRHRRSAEAAVMQIIPDELVERAAQGQVSVDEINEILEKLKTAKIDGRPKGTRSSREGNGSPLDQTHGHLSFQQKNKPPQQRGRGSDRSDPENQKTRGQSKSPERKLGFYKYFVDSLGGQLHRYPSIATSVQELAKKELKGEAIFVEDDHGQVIIPLKFTPGNKSDRLCPALHGKLPEKAFCGFQVLRDICFGGAVDRSGKRALTQYGQKYKEEHCPDWHVNRVVEQRKESNGGDKKDRAHGGRGGGNHARANASVAASVLDDDDEEAPPLMNALVRFKP